MLKSMITIVAGTNRPDSNSYVIAQLYETVIREKGEECQILDLRDLPSDFIVSECYGNRTEDYDLLLDKYIRQADKFVFVVPEYHGSFPGVLKAFIDSFSGELISGKVAALIGLSSGRAGNLRGLDAFAGVLSYLQVETLATRPKLSGIENILSDGILSSDEGMDRIEKQIDQLVAIGLRK